MCSGVSGLIGGIRRWGRYSSRIARGAGGLAIRHVPSRGIPGAMNDLLGGQIGVIFPDITSQVMALHRSGKLRVLPVNAPGRLEAAPEIPTAAEEGLADFVSQIFFGI